VTTFTITTGYDTFAAWPAPTANYAQSTQVDVGYYVVATQPFYGFVYLPLPPDIIGTTIASATLTGHARSAWAATTTLQAAAVTSGWSDSTLTYNRMPSPGSTSPRGHRDARGRRPRRLQHHHPRAGRGERRQPGTACASRGPPATIGGVFNSFDSGLTSWSLTIVTQDEPEVPQSLVPNGTVVGSGAPTLTCDFVDNGGLSNDMASMNVQISTPRRSPRRSTTRRAARPSRSSTSPAPRRRRPPSRPISSGTTRFWRVRVQDADGNWSALVRPGVVHLPHPADHHHPHPGRGRAVGPDQRHHRVDLGEPQRLPGADHRRRPTPPRSATTPGGCPRTRRR
jgi:hypothetical protein